jgi:hypothetical protein
MFCLLRHHPPRCSQRSREGHALRCTATIDVVEASLSTTLVAMVGGARPTVTPSQVYTYLDRYFNVAGHEVQVRRAQPDDFLLVFTSGNTASRVLHAAIPKGAEFSLFFHHWHHQSRAQRVLHRYNVMLVLENLPVHVWSVECAQMIIGMSCLCFEPAP